MAVTRLMRLGLAVRDLDLLAGFYRDAFGCTLIEESEAMPMRRVSLGLGREIIELAGFDSPGLPWPDPARSNDLTFQHFAIVVADMAKAHAHLLTLPGWTPISPDGPVRLPPSSGGVIAFKFRDPEGHPLELLEFPGRRVGSLFDGIDHSAIVVKDTGRSIGFYAGALGLVPGRGSRNTGPEQARLDRLDAPDVLVTPLHPPAQATPHVELLCYAEPPSGGAAPNDKSSVDAIATRMIFAVDDIDETIRRAVAAGGSSLADRGRTAFLRDPDEHDIVLVAPGRRSRSVAP